MKKSEQPVMLVNDFSDHYLIQSISANPLHVKSEIKTESLRKNDARNTLLTEGKTTSVYGNSWRKISMKSFQK
ncbi:hypothetical protein DH09_01140 (plasmid) [Bacillaceae bacterium JMAK1]|nr:hypothetical protein DH09_01140 [Bacillaceae bacterium JMAK1]